MLRRDNKYFKWGLTAVIVLMTAILFWLIFSNLGRFYNLISEFFGIISSLLYGCTFAYLMNPILVRSERLYSRILRKWTGKEKLKQKIIRTAGITTAVVVFFGIIGALAALIIPSITKSATELFSPERIQEYYTTIETWIHETFAGSEAEKWIESNFNDVILFVKDFVANLNLLDILLGAFSSVYGALATVFNMLIGVIAGVYILIYKGELRAQAKKLTISLFKEQKSNRIFEIARRSDQIMGRFIIGKLIDALFVGVVTYLALLIMDMPFAPLIATLVGVTNIIPFFGPFIGAVPAILLLLIEHPIDAVYFAIFILILQIIDGNIIENRILGEKLGMSDFWVLVAILISGGIFGFVGMLIGVPVFAVVFSIIEDLVNNRLRRKNLPVETNLYEMVQTVSELSDSPLAEASGEESK